jgi:hypothetical protein
MALLKQQLCRGVAGQAGCVFDTVVTFLTGAPATPGRDWTIHADYRTLAAPYYKDACILKNTGKSDNEEIYIGIEAISHPGGVEAGLILRTYYQFDNTLMNDGTGKYYFATSWSNTTYGSGLGARGYNEHCFMPFKTDESTTIWANKPPLQLWVYSNKARVVLIINTEERFSNGYMGQYIRHVTPQEVPYPLCCLSDSFNGGYWTNYLGYQVVDWSTEVDFDNHRRNLIFARHGQWSFATSYTNRRDFSCNRFMTPIGWSYDWYMDPTTSATIGIANSANINYPDGGFEQLLFPVYIYAYTASQSDYFLLGQLDGVYWAPNQRNTSLSEVGTSDCIIFPNLNRTSWYDWMAVKDEL